MENESQSAQRPTTSTDMQKAQTSKKECCGKCKTREFWEGWACLNSSCPCHDLPPAAEEDVHTEWEKKAKELPMPDFKKALDFAKESAEEKCKHEDVKLVGAITNTHICFECKGSMVANEIEILNDLYEVGGFCDNDKCKRYLLLTV